MTINFFLTQPTNKIVGGYKMVYTYADFLARKGYNVNIYYYCKLNKVRDYLLLPIRFAITKMPIPWYRLEKTVNRKVIINFQNISSENINIITASTLAKPIYNSLSNHSRLLHFIQDYECWCISEEELKNIFSLHMKKIAVSNWIVDIVQQYSLEKVSLISNGINMNDFYIETPITNRSLTVCMLYHHDSRKGVQRGIDILKRMKQEMPNLNCIMFGSPPRGKEIPKWVEYHRNLASNELRSIYNRSSVFFTTSYYEGFGLTGLESMCCGCALVSTDTKGVREYATNNETALLCHPEDNVALYQNLKTVLINTELRYTLVNNFLLGTSRFSQDNKNSMFLKIVEEI